jgi:hypothetical protein
MLRRAAAYLGQESLLKMMFSLVLDLAADRIPIAVTCRVLGFSKQAFFKWRANPISQRAGTTPTSSTPLSVCMMTSRRSGIGSSPMSSRPVWA